MNEINKILNALHHARQLPAPKGQGMEILAEKRKTCHKSAEKQSRETFAMMMKNVLCGLKPICAKHRVATSPQQRKLRRAEWWRHQLAKKQLRKASENAKLKLQ